MISYNRGAMLREVLASYAALSDETEIVVHDNGSDDPETVEILQDLEQSDIRVARGRAISSPDELSTVNDTITSHFGGIPSSSYVVTDCDIDLSIAAPDALTIYAELLDQFGEASCAGPMLRIRDIPPAYPLFNRAMNRHIEQFWRHPPQWTETSAGRTAVLRAIFDSNFALHRRGEFFRRFKRGIRTYHPYEARHLDWYASPTSASDSGYERTSSDQISHWNNRLHRQAYAREPLRYREFFYVEAGDDGALTTKQARLRKAPPRR